jgi:prephenate dehydrogenase
VEPPFERVGIVGLGLIGGSVALAAKRRWPSVSITACDPAPMSAEAVTQGLASAVVDSPAGLAACDLIVIATPVQLVAGILTQLSDAGVAALVTDVGSTKRVVMAAASTSARISFIGGHPMAGSESSGLSAARADLFDGRPWLLVSSSTDEAVRESLLASFIVGLGARPEWTDAVTHDRVMAHVSHAPHVVSRAVMMAPGSTTGPAPSDKGVSATTQQVGSGPEVWQGILETNADFIADALAAIAAKLPTSAEALTDAPGVRDVFERAEALKKTRT